MKMEFDIDLTKMHSDLYDEIYSSTENDDMEELRFQKFTGLDDDGHPLEYWEMFTYKENKGGTSLFTKEEEIDLIECLKNINEIGQQEMLVDWSENLEIQVKERWNELDNIHFVHDRIVDDYDYYGHSRNDFY